VQYLIIRAVKPDVLHVFVWNYSFLFSLSFPGAWMLVVQAVFLHTSIWGESSCHMWRNLCCSGRFKILL